MPPEIKSALIAKQRILTEHETESTFTTWQQSIMFQFVIDSKFSRYTDQTDLGKWQDTTVAHRGYTNDATTGDSVLPADTRMTALQKAQILQVLLGSIATFAPVISNKFITAQATCFDDIWNRLRGHYGFRVTGGRILELAQFSLAPDESYETLWERMSMFVEDNLMKTSSDIKHLNKATTVDETLSPTLQNITVVLWFKAINADLPAMIKQRFATQLRTTTLFSLRDDISDSLNSVLAEMQDREYTVNFTKGYGYNKSRKGPSKPYSQFSKQVQKMCCLCDAAGRPEANTHFLSRCRFLPQKDKQYMSRVREITGDYESEEEDYPHMSQAEHGITKSVMSTPISSRVDVLPSPVLEVFTNNLSTEVTIDSGAEVNLIAESECKRLNLKISDTTQKASMADGTSALQIVGEVNFTCVREHHALKFSGLVVRNLNCPILAGMPFLVLNDVYIRPTAGTICIGDCCKFQNKSRYTSSIVRTCTATILRVPQKVVLMPGDEITVRVPDKFKDQEVAVEPREISPSCTTVPDWLPYHTTTSSFDGEIKLVNSSVEPVVIKKDEQFAQVRQLDSSPIEAVPHIPPVSSRPAKKCGPFAESIQVDPAKQLSQEQRDAFKEIHQEFDDVFSPELGMYNGKSGPFKHVINMGPNLPKQRPGRNPLYSRTNMEELQATIDDLLWKGVLAKPEDIGVNVEYVSPSFLVKKSSGGHRLVTAFGDLSEHAIPMPAAMPDVDGVLRQIAQWKYILKTDLTMAYYQILLAKCSRKYVGIVSPFRGTLVYQRAVMGLPGSEASLETLLSRILGDLMLKGSVVKLADDLYAGADTVEELLAVWREVLRLLQLNGMRLSPMKTIICPLETVILGWLWRKGTISSTTHRLNTLMLCDPPTTVHKLRSFVGSYKALAKVVPHHADYLDSFEKLCASNREKAEKIVWTDELMNKFNQAKAHLSTAKVITLPRKDDPLHIVTDASATGLAAAMYSIRDGEPVLSGLFNAKRRPHQIGWLPCELEALSITASVKHFSPYIVQSTQRTKVITDSLPCVNAYRKLARGEFSASPRVTTFLSTLSHYHIDLQHISGKKNTFSDFASRNPVTCDGSCQICKFIAELEESPVINAVTYKDVLSGRNPVPYASRSAWLRLQGDCQDLGRVAQLLKSTKQPSDDEKADVKRYYGKVRLSNRPADGLLVYIEDRPFQPTHQRIVVPRSMVDGLLTAIHIKLEHLTKPQLLKTFNRAFWALGALEATEAVLRSCHTCVSLKKIPSHFTQQSTSAPPECIGVKFSADVIKRERQKILLVREYVTSFSDAVVIRSEDSEDLREGIIKLLSRLRSPTGPPIDLKVDSATALQSLQKDPLLNSLNIKIELGDPKNINKNPISERAISEILEEFAKRQPAGGAISETILALSVAALNSKIRASGFSSSEAWTKRDRHSCKPIEVDDSALIQLKQKERLANHQSSAMYKSRGKAINTPEVKAGEIIYLYQDREKGKCRDKYIVCYTDDEHAYCQKFVNETLRAKRYRVKLTEIMKVQKSVPDVAELCEENSDDEFDEISISLHTDHNSSDDEASSGSERSQEPEGNEPVITQDNPEDENLQEPSDNESVNSQGNEHSSVQDEASDEESSNDLNDSVQNSEVEDPTLAFCPICSEEVTELHDGLLCDHCKLWFHRECVGMSKRRYKELRKTENFEWSCPVEQVEETPRRMTTRSRPPGMILSQTP